MINKKLKPQQIKTFKPRVRREDMDIPGCASGVKSNYFVEDLVVFTKNYSQV